MAQRRDNGAGTIYQRESGSWGGRIYEGLNPNGKPKYKYFSGKTEAEVKRKIREYNKAGDVVETRKITVGEYVVYWLKTYKLGTVKPSSYDSLERTINNQIIPYIGMIQLQQLTSDDIQGLLMDLKNKYGYSYSIVKKAHNCLNAVLKHAIISGDIQKNPMAVVQMPSESLFPQKDIRFFSKKECSLIVEECLREYSTGTPIYMYGEAYILMLNTGLRMGEAIGLKKSDWDQEKRTIHVQRNIQSVMKRDTGGNRITGKELVENTTKTYSGDRIIPLNENATKAIISMCGKHPDSEYIICSGDGKMVPPERLDRTFYRMLKNIGIEQAGTHSLRHTFASLLFSNGADVKTVSTLLGHASIQITLNTYVHLIENIKEETVASLDKIL